MKKLKIGCRVRTPYGDGEVIGYDLEHSDEWRHQVKLDNGMQWCNNHPAFFHNQIKDISNKSEA